MAAACFMFAASSASASPTRGLTKGLLDLNFSSESSAVRASSLDRGAAAGAQMLRITANWARVATARPANPTNPIDPAYDFSALDAIIQEANARGLDVMLTVAYSPVWAEGAGRPASAAAGTWNPDAGAYGAFAKALATRYSGDFEIRSGFLGMNVTRLPRVRYYQAWSEPNLSEYLGPQSNGLDAASPEVYRGLLNQLYDGVKAVRADNVVVTGGTGPFGDNPGGERIRPMTFWRRMLCLQDGKNPKPAPCPVLAKFDVLAHHPINTVGGPRDRAANADDATIPDMRRLRRLLRAAERAGTVSGGRHPLWATELWWESDPPDPAGVPLKRHARWTELALYELWRQRVDAVFVLGVRDMAYGGEAGRADLQSGLFFHDGSPKPALTAFRFPLVADRLGKRKVGVFSISPVTGTLRIERRTPGGWRRVASRRTSAGKVVYVKLRLKGRLRLRAKVGGERSLPWTLR